MKKVKILKKRNFISLLFSNSAGLSMVEVIIAVAMLGGVALGVMQLQKTATNMQTETARSMEWMSAKQNVAAALLHKDMCTPTISQINGALGPLPATGNLQVLATPIDIPVVQRQRFDENGVPITPHIDVFYSETGAGTDEDKKQKILGSPDRRMILKDIKLIEIMIEPTLGQSPIRRANAKIEFIYAKRNCAGCIGPDQGERLVSDFVDIDLDLNSGFYVPPTGHPAVPVNGVITCHSALGNAVESAKRAACIAMDFDQDGNDDYFWNDATQKCEPTPENKPNYCLYGGTFSNEGPKQFVNPLTGFKNCPTPDFKQVTTGYYTTSQSTSCGKSCVRSSYVNYAIKTCFKCPDSAGIESGDLTPGGPPAAGCCTLSCPAGYESYASSGITGACHDKCGSTLIAGPCSVSAGQNQFTCTEATFLSGDASACCTPAVAGGACTGTTPQCPAVQPYTSRSCPSGGGGGGGGYDEFDQIREEQQMR